MQIYLPVAEMSVNVFLLLGLGGIIGLLSGMFGVGGGFLLTPLLMFIGVPPPIAVASAANQITAASVSGLLAHWRRGNVDFKMGIVLTVGGGIGSAFGVYLFSWLRALGQMPFTATNTCFSKFVGGVAISGSSSPDAAMQAASAFSCNSAHASGEEAQAT